ncbi:hypothetical protein CLU79DRAFT_749472 [Phycomyces nitens]|nr:hypothetical protein CLU79DRAFT_749472 [Phycomyces nitens]
MAPELPPRILSYIGTHLEKKDRLTCALVCKHWTEPFLDSYWDTLEIGIFTTNIRAIFDRKQPYQKNAHRVWGLKLDKISLDDLNYVSQLQQMYPTIKYLECKEEPCNIAFITELIDWKFWKSLSHLEILFSFTNLHLDFNKLIIRLSRLTGLVHLALGHAHDAEAYRRFLMSDFEALHNSLPLLKYLKLDFILGPASKDDFEGMKNIIAAETMTTIEFSDHYIDTLWITYFALKYPNLQQFTVVYGYVEDKQGTIDCDEQQYQDQVERLSKLDQFFPCLKKTNTPVGSRNGWPFFILYEALERFGTVVENVELNLYNSPSAIDTFKKCITSVAQSLKVLSVSRKHYVKLAQQQRITIERIFPRLVELRLSSHKDMIEIDNILNQCPVMRVLYIEQSMISLSQNVHSVQNVHNPHNIHKFHPLHRLEIKDVAVNTYIFTYISFRCNQLKIIRLDDIGIPHPGFEETGRLIIDLPLLRLDKLILGDIGPDISVSLDFKSVRYYVIEQMDHRDGPIEEAQTNRRPRKKKTDWYHLCVDRTNRKERMMVWQLGRREVEFSQRYFMNFKNRRSREKNRKDLERYMDEYVLKRFWKRDLQYGVLVIRLKSVKNYFIGMA